MMPAQITPLGPSMQKSMRESMQHSGCGFQQSVPKLPPIQNCMTNSSAYNLCDMRKDPGFYEVDQGHSQQKNLGMNNSLYDYQQFQPQHLLTNQLIQAQVGMSQSDLLNSLKMKHMPEHYHAMPHSTGGQNMNMMSNAQQMMQQKDSFDGKEQDFNGPARSDSFTIQSLIHAQGLSSINNRVPQMNFVTLNNYHR